MKSRGFTLIEMMIVITLVGIVSLGGLASYVNSQRSGRDSKRKTDLEVIRQGLELFKADNGVYAPTSGSTSGNATTILRASLSSPTVYITSSNFPIDPLTGYNYYYNRTATTTYYLCAYLENGGAAPGTCPATVSCGARNCNHGVTQP